MKIEQYTLILLKSWNVIFIPNRILSTHLNLAQWGHDSCVSKNLQMRKYSSVSKFKGSKPLPQPPQHRWCPNADHICGLFLVDMDLWLVIEFTWNSWMRFHRGHSIRKYCLGRLCAYFLKENLDSLKSWICTAQFKPQSFIATINNLGLLKDPYRKEWLWANLNYWHLTRGVAVPKDSSVLMPSESPLFWNWKFDPKRSF